MFFRTALNSGNRQASKPMIDYSRATIEEETIEHTSMSSENVTEKLVAPVPMTPTSINLTGKSISDLSSLALSHLITEERNASEISLNRTMTDDESILVADSEIDPWNLAMAHRSITIIEHHYETYGWRLVIFMIHRINIHHDLGRKLFYYDIEYYWVKHR